MSGYGENFIRYGAGDIDGAAEAAGVLGVAGVGTDGAAGVGGSVGIVCATASDPLLTNATHAMAANTKATAR
ncbi:MAG: hypothetical protein WB810_14790 [Candidatus Cybelea sp.]